MKFKLGDKVVTIFHSNNFGVVLGSTQGIIDTIEIFQTGIERYRVKFDGNKGVWRGPDDLTHWPPPSAMDYKDE